MHETVSNGMHGGAPPIDGTSTAKLIRRILFVLIIATAFFLWALTWKTGPAALPVAAGSKPAKLPVIAEVPDFSLTERSGRTITRGDLLGTVWVADFIFTRCAGPCPKISAKMRAVQNELGDTDGARIVSICLDPENDTPPNLVHYAKRFNADGDRWWFLTGTNEDYVQGLVEKGFLQSVVPADGDTPLMHSTYLVVIDREGRIRSAHDGVDPGAQEAVLHDIRRLLAEPASG